MTRVRLYPATAVGLIAGGVCLVVMLATLDSWRSGFQLTGSYSIEFVGSVVIGSFATVGIPVVAYLRRGVVSPSIVLLAHTGFWTIFAQGVNEPGALLVVSLWPVSLLLYITVATVEYRVWESDLWWQTA